MSTPLRALIVEDSEDDYLLLKNELARGGYEVSSDRVETADAMKTALGGSRWDVIISDHRMPQFSSLAALKLCKEHAGNVPFIIVSGSMGEELAVSAMKAGASDYIMKDNLARLVPTVERELREAENQRQRERAEEAEEQIRRRLELILDAAGEGICGLDADGKITFINPRGAKLAGWKPEDLIGKALHETLHHSRADGTPFSGKDCSLCATLRDGLAHWMDSEVFWRKDGSAFPVEYTCTPMRDGNRVVGAVLTFQNIADRKIAEVALRESNRQLERTLSELRQTQQQVSWQERFRALGQMASGVVLDLDKALSKILGFTELLLTSPQKLQDSAIVRDHLRLINIAAKDAAAVLHRLREFYRPRRETERFDRTDLNKVVEQAVQMTEPKWKRQAPADDADIQVRCELHAVAPVAAEEGELREALANLIFNAVDAMPKGGTITLCTRTEGDQAILEITDTGTGMSEEVRARCFEPFFSTKGENGTGLGLAIVLGIIQRHQGSIEAQSRPGEGTTFTIRLPVHPGGQPQPVRSKAVRPLNKGLRVLVVEDEPMVREIEAEYLTADGLQVETAADGFEGLKKFRGAKFDLVLVDRAMPEMNGDQLAEAIKHFEPETPVILVTGFTDAVEPKGDGHSAADLILRKPFSRPLLHEAIQKALVAT
jgi:PAS domain S-box-containing protein